MFGDYNLGEQMRRRAKVCKPYLMSKWKQQSHNERRELMRKYFIGGLIASRPTGPPNLRLGQPRRNPVICRGLLQANASIYLQTIRQMHF